MNEVHIIKFLSLFEAFYVGLGVDYEKMIEILRLKLIMDKRRVSAFNQMDDKAHSKKQFLRSMIMTAVMGVMIGLTLFLPVKLFIKMQIFTLMFLVILISIFMTDYSAVLLDVNEKRFFGTKPIDERTIAAAKFTHIAIYLTTHSLSLGITGILIGTMRHGLLFFGMSISTIVLMVILSVILSSFCYAFLLRFFSGERLRDILNYFQVLMTIFLVLGYQVIPRLIGFVDLNVEVKEYPAWIYLLPSSFLSAPYQLLFDGQVSKVIIFASVASVAVPILLLILYLAKVMPYFEDNLYKLELGSSRKERSSFLWSGLIALFGSNREEKCFMRLYLILFQRERSLKLRVLPQLALGMIFPYLFLFSIFLDRRGNVLEQMRGSSHYMNLYFSAFLFSLFYTFFEYSEKYKQARQYEILPIVDETNLYTAGLKVVCLKYIVPAVGFHCLSFVFLTGVQFYLHYILIFSNIITIFLLTTLMGDMKLPLSMKQGGDTSFRTGRFFLSLLPLGVLFFIHGILVFSKNLPRYLLPTVTVLSVILLLFIWMFLMRRWIRHSLEGKKRTVS